ncbi:MAG: thioredoxin domain-containing protein [Candidatus Acidiferrales bacterium]
MNESAANRLQKSASPYLRSAAHQPVDWHEWGEEAFGKARAEGKPILLDIGAVWCHWCHVIDRESYENPDLAGIINKFYVPVKVDRDERPDVDARYQAAVSAISGQGGWPLTAFLTPEGKPFFGGTYFPPDDAMGRPGFKRILLTIAQAFQTRREEVDNSARALEEAVSKAESFRGAKAAVDPGIVDSMVDSIVRMFDLRNGGFGQSPKFPHASAIDLLLEQYQSKGEPHLLTVAEKTLEKMALGGVYDQLGGGFHRYSVDERWIVPHFEKMSYDNSELLKNYSHGFQVTRKPLFRETAEGIIAWVGEVLSDQERGGFYASQDADQSLDDDGDYFTWTVDEVRAVLSPEEARVIELYYDVALHGEMHHNPAKNALWVACGIEEIAKQLGSTEADIRLLLARAKGKMLEARRKRSTPAVDPTLYVGWNAMFVSAFLEAGRVLSRDACRAFALKTLERILAEAWDEKTGFAHRIGGPRLEGSLDDQIFTVAALLDAYEATLERRYFESAERALRLAIERFGDSEAGGFFDRPRDAAPIGGLEVRRKPFQDSPTPGTNSVAAIVLERMYGFTGNRLYREWGETTLEAFAGIAPQYGLFAATYTLAALLHARHSMQVVVTGSAQDSRANTLETAALEVYRFGKAVLRVTPERQAAGGLAPALQETIPNLRADLAQASVCVETSCHPPSSDPETLTALLRNASAGAVAR